MEMGSSSLGVLGSSGSNDSIHGLKFGKKIYFEDVGNAGITVPATGTDTAPASVANGSKHPAPGKKGRGGGQGAQQQPPRCQVEGCKVDLTGTKTYYCRHKVCGMHSKSPKVRVNGMEQRFCQQCSRFHQLHEFDQGKRSCRRRLAGHNERRRKPPSWPISTRYGCLSSSIHEDGSRFRGYLMNFTYPTLPAAATDAWPNARPEDHPSHHPCQGTLSVPPSSRVAGQMMHLYRQGSAMFANNDVRTTERLGISNSSCALSLLSNQPWASSSAAAASSGSPVMTSTNNYGGNPVVQSNVGASFLNNTWNFKHQEASSAILELPSEMGLALAGGSPPGSMNGHFSVEHEPGNGHFSGELELALQGSREYASSGNLVHWSL